MLFNFLKRVRYRLDTHEGIVNIETLSRGGKELLAGKITARKPERVGRALGPGPKKNAISFRTLE